MKKLTKTLAAVLTTVMLFTFSVAFIACGFPQELEDGRFYFTRVRFYAAEQEFDALDSHQAEATALNWAYHTTNVLRSQVPQASLPIFEAVMAILPTIIRSEWTWAVRRLETTIAQNEGRFLIVTTNYLTRSYARTRWDSQTSSHITTWEASTFAALYTLQNGRFIGVRGGDIPYERTNFMRLYYRAFSQNRIVRTYSLNLKYVFFDQFLRDMLLSFGVPINAAKIRDFWITQQISFMRA